MRKKKIPVLVYQVLAIPVAGGGRPFCFILPKRVAALLERKARNLHRSVEEHFIKIGQQDVTLDDVMSLAEFERGRQHWVREFEQEYNAANGFRIQVEFPPRCAEDLLDRLPAGQTLPEFLENEMSKAFEPCLGYRKTSPENGEVRFLANSHECEKPTKTG